MKLPRWSRLAIAITAGWLISLTGFLFNDYYSVTFCLEHTSVRDLSEACEIMFWSWQDDWFNLTLNYKRLIVIAVTPVVLVWFYFAAIIWADSSFKKTPCDTQPNNANVATSKAQYPWKYVLIWVVAIFIASYFSVTPPDEIYGNNAIAYKIFFASIYTVIMGLIISIYKYFRR